MSVVRLPTSINPDSVLEQAIGQFEYVVIVGLNKDGDIDFREGGDNKEADLSIPFTVMSKVCHKILAGDYDA